MDTSEHGAIRAVIERAYIEGVHRRQDDALVATGFHPAFKMLVADGDGIETVSTETWLRRMRDNVEQNPGLWCSGTEFELPYVDITRNAACATVEVFKGGNAFSTDYMLLYRSSRGWLIVSKIFSPYG